MKGKITILNNLALSPLIYASSVVNTPIRAANEINRTIQAFIWDNSTSKIAHKTLLQKIEKRGLKLCHFPTKVNALKLSWVKRLTSDNDSSWKILPKHFYKCDNLNIYFGANHKLLHKEKLPNFYIDIHNLYMQNFKQPSNNLIHMLNQSLWSNENLKIGISDAGTPQPDRDLNVETLLVK